MKILITGYGGHGKDEFCSMLGLTFTSASDSLLEDVVWPEWGARNYATKEECFADRYNHRDVWYNMLSIYNTPDLTRLARRVLSTSDAYCGMRRKEELEACMEQGLFDLTFWIDASKRLPPESKKSCTVTKEMCMFVINNNGDLDNLRENAYEIRDVIKMLDNHTKRNNL